MNGGLFPTMPSAKMFFISSVCQHFLKGDCYFSMSHLDKKSSSLQFRIHLI
jgi:hypothetical protein